MSRNYRVLGAALVGVLVMMGLVRIMDRSPEASASTSQSDQLTAGTAVAGETSSGVATGGALVGGPTGTNATVTDVIDGDVVTTVAVVQPPAVAATCSITEVLEPGATGDSVGCLQTQLSANGYTSTGGTFDSATDQAVRAFQAAKDLEVDGIVGRQTAQALGIWAGGDGPLPARDSQCPDAAHAVLVDRAAQRAWLCEDGALTQDFPMTSAWSQPDPGTYKVYAKDLNASSNLTGQYSTMTHFVAFTKGKYKGARIAFHSVPKYSNGEYIQTLESVGTEALHGASSGCIRLLPNDAVMVWDYLDIGDIVRVIS